MNMYNTVHVADNTSLLVLKYSLYSSPFLVMEYFYIFGFFFYLNKGSEYFFHHWSRIIAGFHVKPY